MIKKLKSYWNGKSVKQRVYICIAVTAMLMLSLFTVKGNFFDSSSAPPTTSESAETAEYEPSEFHISLIDAGILVGILGAYSVHKIREKRKQRRL